MRFTILFMLLVVLAPLASSLQEDEFIEQVAKIVYEGCKGEEITLKENFFIRSDQRGFVTSLPANQYNLDKIKVAIEFISHMEPFSQTSGFVYSRTISLLDGNNYRVDNDGAGIIKCGNNRLDVSVRDYLWNGVEIKPRDIAVYGGQNSFGDQSPFIQNSQGINLVKDCSEVNIGCKEQTIWAIVITAIVTWVVTSLLNGIYKKYKENKNQGKKKKKKR